MSTASHRTGFPVNTLKKSINKLTKVFAEVSLIALPAIGMGYILFPSKKTEQKLSESQDGIGVADRTKETYADSILKKKIDLDLLQQYYESFSDSDTFFNWIENLTHITPSSSQVRSDNVETYEIVRSPATQVMTLLDKSDVNKINNYLYHYTNTNLTENRIEENQKSMKQKLNFITETLDIKSPTLCADRKQLTQHLIESHRNKMAEMEHFSRAIRDTCCVAGDSNEVTGEFRIPKYRPFLFINVGSVSAARGLVFSGIKTTYNSTDDIVLCPSFPMQLSDISPYLFARSGYLKYYTANEILGKKTNYDNTVDSEWEDSNSTRKQCSYGIIPGDGKADIEEEEKEEFFKNFPLQFTVKKVINIQGDAAIVRKRYNCPVPVNVSPVTEPPKSLSTLIRNPVLKVLTDYFRYINQEPHDFKENYDVRLVEFTEVKGNILRTLVEIDGLVIPVYIKCSDSASIASLFTRLTSDIIGKPELAFYTSNVEKLSIPTTEPFHVSTSNLDSSLGIYERQNRFPGSCESDSRELDNEILEEVVFGPTSRFA